MKKIYLFLCLALVLSLMLSACGGEVSETTPADTSASETTAVTEPAVTSVDIVRDGKALFDVIRDEDADTSALVVSQARSIIDKVKGLTGAMLKLNTDWVKRGEELDSTTYEILLGITDYPETKQVMESLKYGECAIRLVGNKIVVFG